MRDVPLVIFRISINASLFIDKKSFLLLIKKKIGMPEIKDSRNLM